MSERLNYLSDKAKSLPLKSGCYLMKDKEGEVLYVGKAKKLRSRVSSYFTQSSKSPKTEILVSHIRDFDFVLTENDVEALVLENNLIKKHKPKYNIRLRDDKTYPYVVLDRNEDFPRFIYTRKVKRGKNIEVFGPFVDGTKISQVLRIITKAFNLRDCNKREFNSRKKPCLLYQMKQCSAPCVDYISKENYENDLQMALNIFKGKGSKSIEFLEGNMRQAADLEHFERAAFLRDNIEVLNDFIQFSMQKNAELKKEDNLDIIAYHKGSEEIDIAIYMLRNGNLLGHKNFHFPLSDIGDDLEEEILGYLYRYYSDYEISLPEKMIVPFKKEQTSRLEEAFKKSEIKLTVKGVTKKFQSLSDLALNYAKEQQKVREANSTSVFIALKRLGELVGLKDRPIVLECYDIAIWQGSSPTAAQIVFKDGRPEKELYRHYHMKILPEGNNDFAMMSELIERRIKHGNLPDIFIVDGGKGQVSSFEKILKEKEVDIPVVGIAKAKTKKGNFKSKEVVKTEERLIIPNRINPYILTKNPPLFKMIVHMRDEAHRFSRRLHHKNEKKKTIRSWVDQVEGIGPKTRKKILERMDLPINEIKKYSVSDLSKKFEINTSQAENILKVIDEL